MANAHLPPQGRLVAPNRSRAASSLACAAPSSVKTGFEILVRDPIDFGDVLRARRIKPGNSTVVRRFVQSQARASRGRGVQSSISRLRESDAAQRIPVFVACDHCEPRIRRSDGRERDWRSVWRLRVIFDPPSSNRKRSVKGKALHERHGVVG